MITLTDSLRLRKQRARDRTDPVSAVYVDEEAQVDAYALELLAELTVIAAMPLLSIREKPEVFTRKIWEKIIWTRSFLARADPALLTSYPAFLAEFGAATHPKAKLMRHDNCISWTRNTTYWI